jgi:uncharacterized membrane protein
VIPTIVFDRLVGRDHPGTGLREHPPFEAPAQERDAEQADQDADRRRADGDDAAPPCEAPLTSTRVVRQQRHVALLWAVSSRRRALLVGLAGVTAGFVAAWFSPWQLSTLIGWLVAAALYLVWVWTSAFRFSPEETMRFARREDDSRPAAQLLVLTACVVSLVGVGFDLLKASESGTGTGDIALVSAAVATVVLSWATVHTVYTLRYAHEYYAEQPVGGFDFKSGPDFEPDYLDFAYVAFGIGMTFQVADTEINDQALRHIVLFHSMLSYLFGAVILAVLINVVAAIFQ